MRRLMKDIEDREVDVVVVYKIDRLSRSLMDFAKLVEVFDRTSVTFVSVTQSFNTTTSMGRLTLNVLLSFSQFEREVTGERIRDKFAASKKKGMWMGGNPPLGYDVANRKLVVNAAEADSVRLIFQRYLDLGCARLLCADLEKQRIVSKRRTFANGESRGGKPIGRSALYAILNNRAYVGETTHKGASYRGEHQAIVPRDLFDTVQQKLADGAPPSTSKVREAQDAPYVGLLFDETGERMLPTYSVKGRGMRYRYYVSRPSLKGERSKAAICRIPAPPLEAFLAGVFGRLGLPVDQIQSVVGRINILPHSIVIHLDRSQSVAQWRSVSDDRGAESGLIADRRQHLLTGETLSDAGNRLVVVLPVRARFRGGASTVFPNGANGGAPSPDLALIKAVARAHRWREMLTSGEADSIESIARRFGLDRGHVGLTLNLAFLSPALTRAILKGEQPSGLRLIRLLDAEIPLSWREQEEVFGPMQKALSAASPSPA
jgi:site-specific DNA recombinase